MYVSHLLYPFTYRRIATFNNNLLERFNPDKCSNEPDAVTPGMADADRLPTSPRKPLARHLLPPSTKRFANAVTADPQIDAGRHHYRPFPLFLIRKIRFAEPNPSCFRDSPWPLVRSAFPKCTAAGGVTAQPATLTHRVVGTQCVKRLQRAREKRRSTLNPFIHLCGLSFLGSWQRTASPWPEREE